MVLVEMWLLQSSNGSSLSDTAQSKRYRFEWIPAYKEEYSSRGLCWSSRESGLDAEKGCGFEIRGAICR